ncbi:MAG: FliM/FliN family flagellar motor switch protein [Planctomycetota bacterium]
MSDLSADETQALQAVAGAKRGPERGLVSERNFSQPRRLSAQRLQHLAKTVSANLQDICNRMAAPLRSFHKLTMGTIGEVNAVGLFEELNSPFVILGLQIEGALGWLVWDERAATATIEQILAGELASDEEIEARELSASEARVLERMLAMVVEPIGQCLGLKIQTDGIAQDEEGLKTIADAGPDADTRRLMVHLVFDGPGGPSDMRLYLPNIDEDDSHNKREKRKVVPAHLDLVNLEVRVELGCAQVALRDLLALEVGDVIPLGTEFGGPVNLYVEDRAIANGQWGQVGGVLSMQIHEIDTESLRVD